MLSFTSLTLWLGWEQDVSSGSGFAGSSGSGIADNKLVVEECLLSHLTIRLHWEQAGSSGMLTLTSRTIWLRWEQAVTGGSGFAGSSGSGFAGSRLVVVECSLSPLTIWLHREQAVSSGSGFAGSKLVAVEFSLSPL
jgi:hypothetical protein